MIRHLPDIRHEFDTLAVRAKMRVSYEYFAADDLPPSTPEHVEIERVGCRGCEFTDSDGWTWAVCRDMFVPSWLSCQIEERFRQELGEKLEAMCLADATSTND